MGTQPGVPVGLASPVFGMSPERLKRRVQSGEIPGYLEDGRWFVAAEEVDRERARRAETAAAPAAV